MASRMTPITLNRREYNLYFAAGTTIKANRFLRSLGRLKEDESTEKASVLIGGGDTEVIAVYLLFGLDHLKIQGLKTEKLEAWLDEVMFKRREAFFSEIQEPLLDALKAAGQITWNMRTAKPADGEEAEETEPEVATRPTEGSRI